MTHHPADAEFLRRGYACFPAEPQVLDLISKINNCLIGYLYISRGGEHRPVLGLWILLEYAYLVGLLLHAITVVENAYK